MIIQLIVSFVAVFFFSIVLGVPKKFLMLAGLTGAIGWIVFLVFSSLGISTIISSIISALIVAIISAIFSKIFKSILSIFFIPGILPIVPGVAVYKAVYYTLANDFSMTRKYFYETILIAGAIALSIFLVESIRKIKIIKKENE